MKLKLNNSIQKAIDQLKKTLRKTEIVLRGKVHGGGETSSTDASI